MKNRLKYFLGFILILIIEILIALYIDDKIIRPYIGDMLVIICIYLLLKTIFNDKIKKLSLYVFIFAVIIELMQYFNIMEYLSQNNETLSIALGKTFDIKDIICYFLGYMIIIIFEIFSKKDIKNKA